MKHIRNYNFFRIQRIFGNAILLLVFLLSFKVNAQEQLDLNGKWDIIFDNNNEGKIQKWFLNSNFEKNPNKREIEVPSCWEEIEKDYEGVAFYRKKFTVPASWEGKIISINFDAVNYAAEVWMNNKVVDFHEGGFTPFSFRVDKSVKFGEENVLTMRVVGPIILTDKRIDNMGRQETPQWRGGIVGGIWQPVNVTATDLFSVKDVFIETDIYKKTASFKLDIESNNINAANSEVCLIVTSPTGQKIAEKKKDVFLIPGTTKMQWEIEIPQAQNWSLDNPYLYNARVELRTKDGISDSWEHKFGMREFTIRDKTFYLNGEPIYLKASFFEGLYPTRIAYPDSKEMAIKEIKLAKDAGFNMIRPWRKPPPKMWLDLCDSLGVMTVGSLVVECMHRPVSTPYLAKWVEIEVRESILRDRNRTCVVQWELFNEANRPVLQQMMHKMSVVAQELDPSRLILDESGGTKGAYMYLPYRTNPILLNDIHTYPGGQVNQQEYNRLLIIGKTPEKIEAMGLQGLRMPGRNVQPKLMSFLSELGYASWPDIISNNKAFENANTFVPAAVSHKKFEEQLYNAFEITGFNKVFPSLQDYCLEEQKIHGIANKRMIEATRANPDVSGYCIHALTDGDWILGASILDLWRNPKTYAYTMTKEANQPQIVSVRVLPRNIYAQKGGELHIIGINELNSVKGKVKVRIESDKGKVILDETFEKDYKKGVSMLYQEKLQTAELAGSYVVKVSVFDESENILTSNTQNFDVFTQKQLKAPKITVAVLDEGKEIERFLKSRDINCIDFSENMDTNIPVLVGSAPKGNKAFLHRVEEAKEFAKRGGSVTFLQNKGVMLTWGAPNPEPKGENEDWHHNVPRVLKNMEIDKLPFNADLFDTSGNYTSRNHIVTRSSIFKGLPVNVLMSGVYENVCAVESIIKPAEGKYLAGVITHDQNKNMDIMQRHYNGIGDVIWAADVLLVEKGKGKMLFSTLRIIENLGKDPVADMILNNMIQYARHE